MTAERSLASVAEALEAELRRYEQLATALQHERLTSEKGLRRATQKLGDLAAADGRLGERLQALVATIGAARERQQTQADAVQARAEDIRRRSEVLSGLLARWETLGRDAGAVSQLVQQLTDGEAGNGGADRAPDAARFGEVAARLARLAEDAALLVESARAAEFADVAEQAASLRQQLLSAANKVELLRARVERD